MDSKNTVAISYNDIVHGFTCPTEPAGIPEYFSFAEGVWNEPPLPYGDSILLKGKLETVEGMKSFVSSIDRRIDQMLIYAGSLKTERRWWLQEAIEAVRSYNPDCQLLIFVCNCAQSESHVVSALMKATSTGVDQWFEQSHIGVDPYFDGVAPGIGNNSMWYTLMVCRRYGQTNIQPASHLSRLRANPPENEPGIAEVLGKWLTQV